MGTCSEKRVVNLEPAWKFDKIRCEQNEKGNIVRDEPTQECMAKLLRLFETLTNTRKSEWHLSEKGRLAMGMAPSDEPEEYPIKLAYSVIVELLFHTYGESTVRNSLAVLIEWGYLKRYQKNKGSTPFYILNIPVLQVALQKQAEKPGQAKKKRVLHSTPRGPHVTPTSSNSTPRGSNSTPNKKEKYKITSINKINGKRESTSARMNEPVISPTLSLDQQIWFEEVYCQSQIGVIVPDTIDEIFKRHLIAIMKHAKTVEELNSLYDYVKRRIIVDGLKDDTVYPGNLANRRYLAGWLQEKERSVTTHYGNDQDNTQQGIIPATSGVQRSTRRARKHQEQGQALPVENYGWAGSDC